MNTPLLLLEYTSDLLNTIICKKLDDLLLAALKYNTLPVGILQFLISKINLQPIMVLTVYDNKEFITSICKNDIALDNAMTGFLPDAVTPTIIIYPTKFLFEDIIYNYADLYYYSSLFSIDIKRVREGIKDGNIIKYSLYTDSEARKRMSCEIDCTQNIGLVKLPDIENLCIKLPFRNIMRVHPLYEGILASIMENNYFIIEPQEIDNVFTNLKENKAYTFNHIQLFKDFIKQKPLSLMAYTSVTKSDVPIRSVCLKMEFNFKLTHVIFYRYIDGIVNKIIGSISEVKEIHGK
jgi:hypothetical protein